VSGGDLRGRVLGYLAARSVATLATTGADGPWAAAVFYATREDFTLYFLSSPSSRHCANLAHDPRVAAAIHEDTADWRAIKGVQLEGRAAELEGAERAEAQRRYGARFPVVGSLGGAPAALVAALAKVRWYKLVPARLFFIDNAAGFGRRAQVEL
jgi:hypothetical protein